MEINEVSVSFSHVCFIISAGESFKVEEKFQ